MQTNEPNHQEPKTRYDASTLNNALQSQTVTLPFDNDTQVLGIVISLVNTCKNSLRQESQTDTLYIIDNCIDVANVLELTEKLLYSTQINH